MRSAIRLFAVALFGLVAQTSFAGDCGCAAAPTCGSCGPTVQHSHRHVRCGLDHFFGRVLAWPQRGHACHGCDSCAHERTFLFGSCRQFFHGCGGCRDFGPAGRSDLGDYNTCTYGSYLNR